jgi:hypothetical protein
MEPKHHRQQVKKTSTLLAGLELVGLDQSVQDPTEYDRLNLCQECLSHDQLIGGHLHLARAAELHAAHQSSPGLY